MESVTPVKEWRRVEPRDAIAQIKQDPRFAVKSRRLHGGEVSPVTLYCYLKTRFGEPSGEMMAFRSSGSDNVVQWHYKLSSGAFILDICGTNAGLQFIAHGVTVVPSEEWTRTFEELKAAFAAAGSRMGEVRRRLEKWSQFVNPFRRLEQAVVSCEDELKGLELAPPTWPPEETGVKQYLEALGRYSDASVRARTAGFCLRLLAPIYAESFVNFVLYFFRSDALAGSDERYRAAVRLPIHERVLSLPGSCQGFPAPLDENAAEYREFLRLMNGRNDLVHGNCDPTQLRVGDVFFDGTIPLWQEDGSTIVRLLQQSLRHVAKDDALMDAEIVRTFIRWILASMKPEIAKHLRRLMASEYPGLRSDTGRPGILLPNNVYESYLG